MRLRVAIHAGIAAHGRRWPIVTRNIHTRLFVAFGAVIEGAGVAAATVNFGGARWAVVACREVRRRLAAIPAHRRSVDAPSRPATRPVAHVSTTRRPRRPVAACG